MEQTKDVVTQIRTHYDSFSKSHRRLADFILENLYEVAFLSINELSQRTGISPATITRFARRLDFQGYPDLQRGLYEHQKQWAPFGQLKSLLRRETPAEDAGPDSLQWTIQNNIGLLEALYTPQLRDSFARAQEILHQARTIYIAGMRSSYATQWTIQNNIGLLEALYTPQLRDSFARAQEILHQARTIYIAGMRSSYATAYYLAFMLQQMCDNVHLLTTSTSDLPTALSDVRPEDCLLVISYARYTSSSYDIVSHFHRAGCKIVALTDSLTSPIALKATEVLIAPNGGNFSYTSSSYDIVSHFHRAGCKIVALTDSLTSPIALKATEVLIAPNGGNFSPVGAITLCNCFITSLGRLNAQQTLERMELQDKIALEHHIYL